MILLTPVFRAIKEKYPEMGIHVLAGRNNYSVIKDNPRLEKVIVHEKTPVKILRTISTLKKTKYEYMIDPKDHLSSESRIFAKLVKAKTKIGFNKPGSKNFDLSIPGNKENTKLHYIRRCFNAFEYIGITCPERIPRPELFTNSESDDYVVDFLLALQQKPVIVINISASNPGKMWSNDKWEILIQNIDSAIYNLVLTFAPSEKEVAVDLKSRCPKLNMFRSRSMNDVISLINAGKLLITPDTSLVHVASAFNKPLLGMFSSLEEQFIKFGPLSDTREIIRSKQGDGGIKSIEAEEVIEAYVRISEKFKS